MSWSVYLIAAGNRTYVGSTTDVHRRLRQHNREIVGGAKSTASRAPKWKLVTYISGFKGRSPACRWEAILKKRARGLLPRLEAFDMVARGDCPAPRTARRGRGLVTMYVPPSGLTHYQVEVG